MKRYFNLSLFPWITLLTGAAGLLLRVWLFATGIDSKGLLVETHPANALSWIVTGITMCILFLSIPGITRRVPKAPLTGPIHTWGCLIASVGILTASLTELMQTVDATTTASSVLGIVAAVCLFSSAYKQMVHKRGQTVEMMLVTVYLMVHLVCQYRYWSAEPQLQNYAFQLLASIFLMMTSFYRASLELSGGKLRGYVFCNQTSLFFCCLSLTTSLWPFYLATGIWTVTDLISLRAVRPAKPKNPQPEEN